MTIVRTRTPSGEAIVILCEAEFERLRDLAEDTLDMRALDASEARLDTGDDELLSEADLDALRSAPTPLAFWRARRETTLDALARACSLDPGVLRALERGEQTADSMVYERLAKVLGVSVEDIVPEPGIT